MNKNELISSMANATGMTKTDSAKALDSAPDKNLQKWHHLV